LTCIANFSLLAKWLQMAPALCPQTGSAGFAMIGDSAVDLVLFFGQCFLLLLVQLDLFVLTAAGAVLVVDCTAEGNAIKSTHVKKESRCKCEIRIRNANATFEFEI
jgi:hypothetical protein